MLPTGRRRISALSNLTLCLAFLFLFASVSRAAVVGIDYGTGNIKAALIKPGIPLDIVPTKDSKRKEVAALAFKPNRDEKNNIVAEVGKFPERAYGSDALALQGRFPSEVFPNLKHLLGLQWGSEAEQVAAVYKDRYPGVQLQQVEELGTTVFKSAAFADEDLPFSVEELIGMQLANIKRNAQALAGKGSLVDGAVITVPAFYTADEKQAIVKAASFAGFEVMSLITDGMAVGLDYAKTRTFPEITKGESPEYHMVYDMGAGSTTATVMRFQSRSVKDVGRFNKTIQEVQVLGAGWDRSLGGDALTDIIVDNFVKKLLTKPALKSRGTTEDEIKKNPRIMSRFFKDAEKLRTTLSANTEASASFEEILPDIDLRVKVTRAEFEGLAEDFANRVQNPITEALRMANLGMKDLKSVILHGGAQRTPFVQSKLESAVDDKAKLRSNVNPDESAVFGAAFKAASLSASFKVKEIRTADIASYSMDLVYTDSGKQRKKPLFDANAPFGAGSTTKQVSFKDKEDFTFGFVQNVGGVDRNIIKVQSENLTDSVTELTRRAGCEKEVVNTKFSVRLGPTHGLPEVTGGSVSCEVDEDAKSGSIGDSVKGWLGFGKKDQETLKEAGEEDGPVEKVDAASSSSTAGTQTASSGTASSSKAAETPTKRLEVIPLRWSTQPDGNPQPSKDDILRMTDRLKAFDQSDKDRYAREEAQNVLEAYTYFVRDFLENKDHESVSTKEERSLISDTLKATRDWMDAGENIKAATETLKDKYDGLKKLVEPIRTRRTEGAKRPQALKDIQKSLDDLQKRILKVESDSAKASASIKSAAEAAASSASATASSFVSEATESVKSAVGSDSTASADADDLEESYSETSSSAPPPKATETIDVNPYDLVPLARINDTYNQLSEWLKEKLAEQDKLKPYDDPAVLVREIELKTAELSRSLKELTNSAQKARTASTKKPKPSKSKTSKKAKPTASGSSDEQTATEDLPNLDDIENLNDLGIDNLDEIIERMKQKREAEKADSSSEEDNKKQKKDEKVTGGESIEDMLNWGKKKPKKPVDEHEEL